MDYIVFGGLVLIAMFSNEAPTCILAAVLALIQGVSKNI